MLVSEARTERVALRLGSSVEIGRAHV
jgi:hypothetical protein